MAVLAVCLLCACSGKTNTAAELPGAEHPAEAVAFDSGSRPIAGEPGLSAGARLLPDPAAAMPLPKVAAQAGTDFASNRFIVIFEDTPAPGSIARYLDGDAPGLGSDVLRASDNAPLVQHPFLRKVSHNLAASYGLAERNRVFYKGLNFAVYEMPDLSRIEDLDAMMLRVLNENPGLVRELCYDFYLQLEDVAGLPATEGSRLLQETQQQHAVQSAEQRRDLPHSLGRSASAAPDYSNPDPYYLNQQGLNINLGDGANDSGQWALWRIGATLDEAWSYTTGSSSTVVAVIDTGARYTHEDLTDNVVDPQNDAPYNNSGILTDLVNKDNDPWDGHGHGTFCAGEIGAKGNNGKGVAGVCWTCTVLPIKVINDSGTGTDANIAEGMLLADALGANIASMSLGGYFPVRAIQLAAKQCNSDGMLVICGAGNFNSSAPFYPAYYPECMAVGATTLVNASDNEDFSNSGTSLPLATRHDARATFSCYGSWVDIASPGVRCLGTAHTGDTSYSANWAGTSMATPYVSGCAALLWSYISDPTNDKVRGLLQSGASEMTHFNNASNPKGFLDTLSNGTVHFVNAYQSLLLHESGSGTAPLVSWDNPLDGSSPSGVTELRVAVSGGSGTVSKVEFETFSRLLGVQTAPSGGFYRQNWDSGFEFNRPIELRARVFDDKGNIAQAAIIVTPDNPRTTPNWSENFDSLANNSIPTGWYTLDGNQGSGNTNWGADSAAFVSPGKSMHSSGSSPNYGAFSNDYLYGPVIDLKNHANASLSFQRRYRTAANEAAYFFVSDDDKTYYQVSFANTSLVDWGNYSYDLSGFAGREIRVLWAIANTGGVQTPGIWIDDVNLSAQAGTAPSISVVSPQSGASVSGIVPVTVTVSDDTNWITMYAEPPDITGLIYTPIPDNDPLNPTKSYTINWDSRFTYNGAAQLNLYAWDDENGDSIRNDFSARAILPLSVVNPSRDPVWYEGFENIGTLGGISGGAFDGDWYVLSLGSNTWRISGTADQFRSGAKGCKFGPIGAGNYSAGDFGLLFSPVHDCSAAAHPYLRFWQKLDVEDGTGDVAKLQLITYDGMDDVRIPLSELRADTQPAGQWQEVLVNLARWQSSGFRLLYTFRSDSDSGVGNVGAGWFIDDFEVLDADPQITGLSPARGVAGSSVTVSGLRFGNVQGSSTITFAKQGGGRTTSAVVTSWSNTQIEADVPADAQSGALIVTLLGYDSNGSEFKVILTPPDLDGLNQL
jgi:subtilisin family serine protease